MVYFYPIITILLYSRFLWQANTTVFQRCKYCSSNLLGRYMLLMRSSENSTGNSRFRDSADIISEVYPTLRMKVMSYRISTYTSAFRPWGCVFCFFFCFTFTHFPHKLKTVRMFQPFLTQNRQCMSHHSQSEIKSRNTYLSIAHL